MATCIQTTNLTKHYGKVVAVQDLCLEVRAGEILGLLGLNGAGKSTTLYMLSGLVLPTSGSISVFGRDLKRGFLEIAARIGVLPERPAFYGYLNARENLLLSARLAGREVNVDRVLDLVGLLKDGKRKVGGYSQGMRQRLGLAQALLTEPELLLLDEPATSLDPEGTMEIISLLQQLRDNMGVTIVFSSHMLHEVEELCDRVAIIHGGKLVACEETDALVSYDQSRVEVLIDAPESAAKRLATQDWVVSADARPGRVAVVLRDENTHTLTAFLVGSGYQIAGVLPRRRTLHDYFMKALKP